ncbi:34635_t:CDS:2, partial [Gigaspora margarita]
ENITCPVRNCQDRIKNIEAVEEDISNLAEALKPGNTSKRFFLLYKNIDQAEKLLACSEKNVIHAKKEVILSYYQLGKADTEKLKELLKILTPLRTAQNKIVADIKKLLPSDTSVNVIKKRIAIARKIYDIFSTIGEDKIQRIRNFSASSIGAFKKDEIEFIKTGDNKSKFRIEGKVRIYGQTLIHKMVGINTHETNCTDAEWIEYCNMPQIRDNETP